MRAVVTGGSGFLGSHLCDRLLSEGWDVLALDNLITGDLINIAHLKENRNFQFVAERCQPTRPNGRQGRICVPLCLPCQPSRLFETSSLKRSRLDRLEHFMHSILPVKKTPNFSWHPPVSAMATRAFLPRQKRTGGM